MSDSATIEISDSILTQVTWRAEAAVFEVTVVDVLPSEGHDLCQYEYHFTNAYLQLPADIRYLFERFHGLEPDKQPTGDWTWTCDPQVPLIRYGVTGHVTTKTQLRVEYDGCVVYDVQLVDVHWAMGALEGIPRRHYPVYVVRDSEGGTLAHEEKGLVVFQHLDTALAHAAGANQQGVTHQVTPLEIPLDLDVILNEVGLTSVLLVTEYRLLEPGLVQ